MGRACSSLTDNLRTGKVSLHAVRSAHQQKGASVAKWSKVYGHTCRCCFLATRPFT